MLLIIMAVFIQVAAAGLLLSCSFSHFSLSSSSVAGPFASPYPGWDRIPIKDSTNNIVTYYYYSVIEGMDF
jgi:hypothetical protein